MTRAAALLTAIALTVAACGPGAGASTEPSIAPSTAPSAEPSASDVVVGGEVYEVRWIDDPTLGMYLVGEAARTLYVFASDTAGSSMCTGTCAETWPPFTLEGDDSVKGVGPVTGTFATITRDDGTTQVTYNGAPLYYFSGDTGPGTTSGQGIGGVWFVAPVSSDSGSPSPSPGGGYY